MNTTGLGLCFPFYATAAEVRHPEEAADRFRLYRVFEFARRPRVYILPGPLRDHYRLGPAMHRAVR